ncbi:hypothetical protein XI04_03480 [Bradyrhizobium sp. CCBAU 11430]|uniref:hypothetical protein n=1 Tax=unclassified Bradyrhizobium TaxID=2631580 RepID=UPI002306498D|nr:MULTISPECIES: hypothetical protein [unclassified Bradyrhizobium]MDA9414111.1 hypothetical protein [Bradyrhizobium sp. CCBAU 25360]MDA9512132.1 hypothetical protein [Bradyrhizobium sp. CCBAU 11430]
MLDATTTALLREILETVCVNVPGSDGGVRAYVASKLLEAASKGESERERLEQIGLDALRHAPSMWR